MPHLASDRYCTGCLACVDACKHQAISVITKNGHPHIKINEDNCINCHLCERTCPIITPVKRNKIENSKVYAGWAKDDEVRINAASGGAFTSLAHYFFKSHETEKVAIFGAVLENNRVKHLAIENEKDIVRFSNSKYIQSNTNGIYSDVAKKLRDGYWIMFSGCPCHIAALYGFLGRRKDSERLITIEVVCHGIACSEALDIHLDYYKSSKIYRFRDKRNTTQMWMNSQCTTIDQNGKEVKLKRKEDIFYSIFASWLLDRKSCCNCQFAQINRVADITLADFWGLSKPEYYEKGVSLIMSNNEKSREFIEQATTIYVFEESLRTAIEGNPNLYTGYKFIQWHPLILWPNFFKSLLPKKVLFKIYTNKMPYKLFWAVFKISTMILTKYKKKKIYKYLENNPKTKILLNFGK